eukprot:TRINITY_DN5841_c1_g1_i1.p1 TRINITY_DN5841_c1_g1~~TRINITY_DN5841_c1_g1_i1.p1  ORF type:complete len:412 (+),score=55.66 TRINITY_DN5841_c1_g1_i1:57-1292(+)
MTKKWWEDVKHMQGPHWYVMHSPAWVISMMILIAAVFTPMGALILSASSNVDEVRVRYDGQSNPQCTYERRRSLANIVPKNASDINRTDPTPDEIPDSCKTSVTFQLEKELTPPVFLYYELTDFNENFRSVVRSRSDSQLQGSDVECICEEEPACPPYVHPARNDVDNYVVTVENGQRIHLSDFIYTPCGQLAYIMFNDSFVLNKVESLATSVVCNATDFDEYGNPLGRTPFNPCEKKGIAWDGDRTVKYVKPKTDLRTVSHLPRQTTAITGTGIVWNPKVYIDNGFYWGEYGHRIPNQEDLDFIVWGKAASVPTFKKLHRKITRTLPAGTYRLDVEERYDISKFGEKRIVLATRTWMGADNFVMGVAYCTVGSMSLVAAVVLTIVHNMNPAGGYTTQAFASLNEDYVDPK